MLEKIPPEVLYIILRQVTYKRDIYSLCLTSKTLHIFALPLLHYSLTIIPREIIPDERPLETLYIKDFKNTSKNRLDLLKNLNVSVRVFDWCPHYTANLPVDVIPIEHFAKDFFSIIEGLPNDQLRSFR